MGFTRGGLIPFQVDNALAATAAAWAAGLNPAFIVRALTTFQADADMAPGRFNLLEVAGRQVLLDYGHNVGAMKALGEAVPRLGRRRTVMVIGLPGDRRDEDLRDTIRATLPFVDGYVLHDLGDRRGRAPNEVPELLRSCLPPGVPCEIVADQREGILVGLQRTRPGDRLLVIADIVEEALEWIQRSATGPAVAEGELSDAAGMI